MPFHIYDDVSQMTDFGAPLSGSLDLKLHLKWLKGLPSSSGHHV